MKDPDVRIKRTKTTTFTIDEESAAIFLRVAVGAPHYAEVSFDGGRSYLNEVTITWTEDE